MASDERKPARFAPWALLTPGGLFLCAFFLAPVLILLRTSLSSRPSRFANLEFTWEFSNFGSAFSDYGPHFLRSFGFAGAATILAFILGYPLAYFIAVYGGKYKDLLIGLVVIPFFTSFLIRTIAWTSILGNQSPLTEFVRNFAGDDFNFLRTPAAVVGGLTYNFLPFMILPIYAVLEQLDHRVVEAAHDLYASRFHAFVHVVLPLSLPGVFAGVLLVFVPSSADYVSASVLGGTNNTMIGNIIQSQYLVNNAYPTAAAITFVLMAVLLIGIFSYARALGTERVMEVQAG